MTRLRVAAAAAVSLALLGGLAHAATSAVPTPLVTPNWSGYLATSPTKKPLVFTEVHGTWTVPNATCKPGKIGASSTMFVGLGGYTNALQKELGDSGEATNGKVGTDTNCTAAGS